MVWYDMIRYDTIYYDKIWYGTVWYDTIYYDMVLYDMIRYDTIWYDIVWYMIYMIWYGIWYSTIRYDMIWYSLKSPVAQPPSVSARSLQEREDYCMEITKNIHANSKTRLLGGNIGKCARQGRANNVRERCWWCWVNGN